jgi:hypothetical protein
MSKYISTDDNSEIENFATEAFVFLLNFLKDTDKYILVKILKIFGFVNIKINELNITTQSQYIIRKLNKKVQPDIVIEYRNKLTVIEVKIDSPLGYKQLELYNKIENVKEVILLCKNIIQTNTFKRILWANIYDILSESKYHFVKAYLYFMEENGMAAYKLQRGIYSVLDQIANLCQLITMAFTGFNNYECSKKPNISKKGYLDFVVKYKGKNIFSISQVSERNKYFVINIMDKKLYEKIDKSNYKWKHENWVFDELEIEKILSENSASDQAIVLNNWFREVIKKIEKYRE